MGLSNFNHHSHRPPVTLPDFSQTVIYKNLTPSQKKFADKFFTGKNLFLSGEVGTGKTYLMRALFDHCHFAKISLARTASTGISAFHLGGQTIHSFAGLGFGDEPIENIIAKVKKNRKACDRLVKLKILVIDEISMIKAELFDKLDLVMKYIRSNNRPFGGAQIVVVGDGLQLPPVWKRDEVKDFVFNSRAWREAGIETVVLKEIVRQDAHGDFARVLSRIRVGDISGIELLNSRVNATFPDDEIEPVRIFCKNIDVNDYNRERLAKLPGEMKRFRCRDSGQDYHTDYFNKNCPAPETLELKLGAQVMLLANLDTEKGFVNGSIGVVKSFGPDGIRVKFKNGMILVEENEWEIREQEPVPGGGIRFKVVARRTQYPLKLSYAVTVYKAMGSTIDRAAIDLSESFADGMAYTALSRVRDLESLSLITPLRPEHVKTNQECLDFYASIEDSS